MIVRVCEFWFHESFKARSSELAQISFSASIEAESIVRPLYWMRRELSDVTLPISVARTSKLEGGSQETGEFVGRYRYNGPRPAFTKEGVLGSRHFFELDVGAKTLRGKAGFSQRKSHAAITQVMCGMDGALLGERHEQIDQTLLGLKVESQVARLPQFR